MHTDTDTIIFFHDDIVILAVAPQFVWLAGVEIAAAPVPVVQGRDIVGPSVSVHTQNGRIYRKLIPADQKLSEIRIVYVVGHEAADIGSPPGNARKTHVQTTL